MRISLGENREYALEERADAIAISLSENDTLDGTALAATWQLDVFANTDVGKTYVGTLNTVAQVNGAFPARVIGYAICPGARGWRIEATGSRTPLGGDSPSGPAQAELRAHSVDPAAYGLSPGVYRPCGRAIINGSVASETGGDTTAPLASSRIVLVGPSAFSGAFGSNETASTIWIMFFDSNVVPANGTQPTHGLSFNVPAGGTFNFVSPLNGVFFARGITWAASSTPDTLTVIGAGATARVVTLAQW